MKSTMTVLVMSFLLAESIQAQAPDPIGGEFQVNSYTTSGQRVPAVAVEPQGNLVVVWKSYGSYGTDTDESSIQGQRYDANGAPVGGEFQVNSYTTSGQREHAVAVEPQGNFVVVWTSDGSYGTDTSYPSIQGQRYDADGAPVGGQFQVNSYTTHYQTDPAVAIELQGNFVVVWNSFGSGGTDTSSNSIQAQRYDDAGAPMGGQFQVNSYTTNNQRDPAVAADAQGNFVVVWVSSYGSYGTDTSDRSIQGQRYDANGAPVGSEFQVNSYTTSNQRRPAVAVEPQGNFVVVWDSDGSDGTDTSSYSTQAQRYDANGAPVGGEFQVNSYTTSYQASPAVVADAQGNFVVVWHSDGSYGTDTDQSSIQGQRYSTGVIFTDGFESGDTSAWSSTVPTL